MTSCKPHVAFYASHWAHPDALTVDVGVNVDGAVVELVGVVGNGVQIMDAELVGEEEGEQLGEVAEGDLRGKRV